MGVEPRLFRERWGMIALRRPGRITSDIRTRTAESPLDRSTVAAVLARYGRVPEQVDNASAISRNPVVRITCDDGSKLVLKRYPDRWATDTIRHEHSILGRLSQIGFPAVTPLPARSGETWIEEQTGRYVLFAHVPGRDYSGSFLSPGLRRRLMTAAARLLADLHAELAGFEPAGSHHLTRPDSREPEPDPVGLLELLLAEPRLASADISWLFGNADTIRHALATSTADLSGAGLPRTVIHGDFGVHNLIVPHLDRPIVHDFELARAEWRLVDLALTLARLRSPSATIFADVYRTARGVSDAEWSRFPTVWQHYHLTGALQGLKTYLDHGGDSRLTSAERRYRQAMAPPDWMAAWMDG